MPLVTLVQTLPFQWRMEPLSPTAQTSLAPLPQTPLRASCAGANCGHQLSVLQDAKFWPLMFPASTVTMVLGGLKL